MIVMGFHWLINIIIHICTQNVSFSILIGKISVAEGLWG